MALLAPFDRPLALRLLGEVARPPSTSPPVAPPDVLASHSDTRPTARHTQAEVAQFLAFVLLTDTGTMRGLVPELEASVDENVVVWSPSMTTTSRTELVAALLESDDAITDVEVSIIGTSTVDDTVYVEWHLEGRFNNAGFLNDDLLVEPSGAVIQESGVLVVVFHHNRATRIRCYYDGLGLLEQVVRPR